MQPNHILIINQPLGNRGDEAAHRALVRSLNQAYPDTKITILHYLIYPSDAKADQEFIVKHRNNHYVKITDFVNYGRFGRLCVMAGITRIGCYIHPTLRKLLPYYKSANIVLSAPGGVCMGGFQNWTHLLLLQIAQWMHKPLAYYSRSFGPFPVQTWRNRRFKKISLGLLRYFDFLSIRDKESMKLADSLHISYTPAIDTAFLEQPTVELPSKILKQIGTNYIVFVPNSLTWHYAYKQYEQKVIDSFYIKIIKQLQVLYPTYHIVMLPQLYGEDNNRDYLYFQRLLAQEKFTNCIAISDEYGSDLQQTIIRNARLMIGARYHSIVFAINNAVPFVALNYEHKIAGMLAQLQLDEYKVDISTIFTSEQTINQTVQQIIAKAELPMWNTEKMHQAHQLAQDCFAKFVSHYS